jgi:hypothetical protein
VADLAKYSLTFSGVQNPLTSGGRRFSTSLLAAPRIFSITNNSLAACSDACDLDASCAGFFYRINSDSVTTVCFALNNIGSAQGIATTTNSFSYTKTVRSTFVLHFDGLTFAIRLLLK